MLLELVLTALAILSLLGSLSLLVFLVITETAAPKFTKSIRGLGQDNSESLVTIIIPARNEEETIGSCLNSLILQSHTNLEILVVDDSSADNTANIVNKLAAADSRIKLVLAGTKPRDWVGKSWPCWRGFEASRGEYLLFVDADSRLAPEAVRTTLDYALREKIDMFSISPRVEMTSVAAKAVMPIISGAINLLYPMHKVNDPKSSRAYVFGTFVLVSRKIYEAIGGHGPRVYLNAMGI